MTIPTVDADRARKTLLEAIDNASGKGRQPFDRSTAIREACTALNIAHAAEQTLVFDAWDDLYRAGLLSYGFNLSNPNPPWARLTPRGVGAVANLSRDPANPAGYRAAIAAYIKEAHVAESYLREALETFNRDCVKAAAVMLGCAAEALNLDLRDDLRAKLATRGALPAGLDDWRVAVVLRTMADELAKRSKDMPRELRERFEAHWPSWSGLFRMTRNEVGHPSSVEPITHDQIHAALLLFHEQARLCHDLREWVATSF